MLDAMRRNANSWVVRILLIFLILSFALWGVGDIFLGSSGRVLAEVGESEVSAREVSADFRSQVETMRRQLGPDFDRRQAASLGLVQAALQAAIARKSVEEHARSLGYRPSDDQIASELAAERAFYTNGAFDAERFRLALRSSGLTEEQYVEGSKDEAARTFLLDLVSARATAPAPLVERLAASNGAKRSGEMIVVDEGEIELDEAEPSEEALAALLEERAADFRTRERRDVTFVTVLPEDLMGEIEPDPAEIEAEYQARIAEFTAPRRVTFEIARFDDRAAAQEAADKLADGDAASLADAGVGPQRFEDQELGALPAEFRSAIEEGVDGPFETAFGWHVLRLIDDQPERVTPLEDAREQLEGELRRLMAEEQIPELTAALDDELGGGATLEEAAQALDLELEALGSIDDAGRNANGERIASERIEPDMLRAAFASGVAVDETSLIEVSDGGANYVFRVDEIEPPRPQTIEEAREALVALWESERLEQAASALIEGLRADLEAGAAPEELAAAEPAASLETLDGLTRDGGSADGSRFSPEFASAAFELELDRWGETPLDHPRGPALVSIDEEIAGEADEAAFERWREAMRADLLGQYEAALRERFPPRIDNAAVAQLIEFEAGEAQPQSP